MRYRTENFSFFFDESSINYFSEVWLFVFLLLTFSGCEGEQGFEKAGGEGEKDTLFTSGVKQEAVENDKIKEASGIAAGIKNENALWVHNDSGDKARIFLISEKGAHLGVYYLENKSNRDWEDMASGPGPEEGKPYLYLADIGDNGGQHSFLKIYRFQEPLLHGDSLPVQATIPESEITEILLQYPDGPRDAECFLLDPMTKDFYIISKREKKVLLYHAPYPQALGEVIQLEMVTELPFWLITAGDISADGSEVLIKNYANIYYWKREEGQALKELLQTKPLMLPYVEEPQGEAIAWKKDGSGYFTLSEKPFLQEANLFYYDRLD